MRRLIFINRYFFPDHSATSQILSDLAFHLAESGLDVAIVTSRQIYDEPRAALPATENIRGLHVHRVPSTRFGRAALPGRALDYFTFYRSVWHCLLEIVRPGDLLVAMTDPPLLSAIVMAAARRRNAKLINWLQDLYPEIALALGVPFMSGPVATALAAARNRSLRTAAMNVAVGDSMAHRLNSLAIPSAHVRVIPNWCDDLEIRPIAADNPLRQTWGLHDKFVFGYSGNLGRAHDIETLLGAAEVLRNERRFLFLMIGGGKRFEEIEAEVGKRGLGDAFRFLPYQDRKMLAYSLGAADAHWLSLKPQLEGLIVPSKFYGIAAAGRPLVVIGDRNGELSLLVREYACGVTIAAGEAATLAGTLRDFADDRQAVAAMGARARDMLDRRFSRSAALARWDALLKDLDLADCKQNPAW